MKLQVNELRVGNFLHRETTSGLELNKVVEISEKGCVTEYLEPEGSYIRGPLKPIPLTEEWLKWFGFEACKDKDAFSLIIDDGWYHKVNLTAVIFNNDAFVEMSIADQLKVRVLDRVKHVHSLQNLYFALTGEELELKEK